MNPEAIQTYSNNIQGSCGIDITKVKCPGCLSVSLLKREFQLVGFEFSLPCHAFWMLPPSSIRILQVLHRSSELTRE